LRKLRSASNCRRLAGPHYRVNHGIRCPPYASDIGQQMTTDGRARTNEHMHAWQPALPESRVMIPYGIRFHSPEGRPPNSRAARPHQHCSVTATTVENDHTWRSGKRVQAVLVGHEDTVGVRPYSFMKIKGLASITRCCVRNLYAPLRAVAAASGNVRQKHSKSTQSGTTIPDLLLASDLADRPYYFRKGVSSAGGEGVRRPRVPASNRLP